MNSWNQGSLYNYGRLPVYNAPPIQGEHAAWQFPMGANSEIYLPDSEENIIWWIRTDNVGNRTVTPFDVTQHKQKSVDLNALVARVESLEEKLNAKPNKPATKPTTNQ